MELVWLFLGTLSKIGEYVCSEHAGDVVLSDRRISGRRQRCRHQLCHRLDHHSLRHEQHGPHGSNGYPEHVRRQDLRDGLQFGHGGVHHVVDVSLQ